MLSKIFGKTYAKSHHLFIIEMATVGPIAFPEEAHVVRIGRVYPILKHISLLSRRTISGVLMIYLIAKLLIQPQIAISFECRFELQNHVYRRLKELLRQVEAKAGTIPSMVTYNGRKMVDRSTITEDLARSGKEVSFAAKPRPTFEVLYQNSTQVSDKVVERIQQLNTRLQQVPIAKYNKWDGSSGFGGNYEMDSLLLQTKQLKSYLEIVTSEHPREMLFKRPVSHIQVGGSNTNHHENYLDIIQGNLNDIEARVLARTSRRGFV